MWAQRTTSLGINLGVPYPVRTAASLAASQTRRAAARAASPCARTRRRCRATTIAPELNADGCRSQRQCSGLRVWTVAGIAQSTVLHSTARMR
jgi:hypothetical protein